VTDKTGGSASEATKKAKKIATWVVVGGMTAIFLFDALAVLLANAWERRWPVTDAALLSTEEVLAWKDGAAGIIHFLNTDNSDCILLESRGHFALVDSGWGSDNPNEHSLRPGYEQRVLDYLKAYAAGPDSRVSLDFVLPTHYHYDHAGGFPAILADPAVEVGTVYLREMWGEPRPYELGSWGIGENRRRIEEAALARGFSIETHLPDRPFALGDMTITLLNREEAPKARGENDNSIVVLIECAGKKALLCGDVTTMAGLERAIGQQAGPVDVVKLGHHGYTLSGSIPFLRETRPQLAVVTNDRGRVYPNVHWNLAFYARAALFSGVRENGLAVTISSQGKIWVTGNLHRP